MIGLIWGLGQYPSGCGKLARRAIYAWRICTPISADVVCSRKVRLPMTSEIVPCDRHVLDVSIPAASHNFSSSSGCRI
jgi:hypothetical protein